MRLLRQSKKKIKYKEILAELILLYVNLNKNKKLKILDIGCGFGEYCNYYSKKYKYECTGIDINKKFIKYAKRKYKKSRFFTEDCKSPPKKIKNNKYDLILFVGSRVLDFAYYKKKEVFRCINNYHDLLKPNGKIVLLEKTNFSGEIEPKAGWKFKTYQELFYLKKNFYGSQIFFLKGLSKLKLIYNNFFLRNIISFFLKTFRSFFNDLNYCIIIPKITKNKKNF